MSEAVHRPLRKQIQLVAVQMNNLAGELKQSEVQGPLRFWGSKQYLYKYFWMSRSVTTDLRMFNMSFDRDSHALRLDVKFSLINNLTPEEHPECKIIRGTVGNLVSAMDQFMYDASLKAGTCDFESLNEKIDVNRTNNIITLQFKMFKDMLPQIPKSYNIRCECSPYIISSGHRYLRQINMILGKAAPLIGVAVPDQEPLLRDLALISGSDSEALQVKLRPQFSQDTNISKDLDTLVKTFDEAASQVSPRFEINSGYDSYDKTDPYITIKEV
jgi:hypothetical protein